MPHITRTLSGRLFIRGLDDPDAIRTEYLRYASHLDAQLARPDTDESNTGGAVEVRFVTDDESMPRTGWIWCKSRYAAAKLVYGNTENKSQSCIERLEHDGSNRNLRVNQWIVRRARNSTPPAHRGWALFRNYVHAMRIYVFWAKQTYKPTAKAHKRRRNEFESGETVHTRYVGM